MTVANRITLIRIAMVPLFTWAALLDGPVVRYAALAIFLLAALTDILDGQLARRMGQVTHFGMFIDPIADKLLIAAALFCFVQKGQVDAVPAIVIIAREFIVTSLRLVAAEQGLVIGADFSGKIKLIVQVTCLAFLFTPLSDALLFDAFRWGTAAVWFMTLVTAYSGVEYLTKHRRVLTSAFSNNRL